MTSAFDPEDPSSKNSGVLPNESFNTRQSEYTYEINIGTKLIDFNVNDEIFYRESPAAKKLPKDCVYCDKSFGKKGYTHCEFCGERACEKCIYKTREFFR